jgi:tetratricopeptide (TPR) repeat protein
VGRDAELGRVAAYLAAPSGPGPSVVVIHGAPGIGKTALAIGAAHRAAAEFTDGVLFGSLGGAAVDRTTVEAVTEVVLGAFVAALQGPDEAVPDGLDARRRRFQELTSGPGRRVLVVLDDAPSAAAVLPLLPESGSSVVLVTSRHALELTGGRAVRLEPLGTDDAVLVLREIVGDQVTQEAGATTAILERTEGSPLALQLAGAALATRPHWTLSAAVESMRLLPSPARASDGQLSRTLDLSFALLTEYERKALLLLGLLESRTFAPWELAALLDSDERTAWRLCDRLAQVRLLEHVTDDATGVVVYRVLEHVRDYVVARLPEQKHERPGALQRLRDQHRARGEDDMRAVLRERVYRELDRGRVAKALDHARDVLVQARDNVRHARADLEPAAGGQPPQAVGAGPSQMAAARLADAREVEGLALAALAEVLAELGGVDDAMEIAEAALATESGPARPRALRCLGRLQRRQRRLDEAQAALLDALGFARDDGPEQARILRELAILHAARGQTDEGLDAVDRALRLDLHPESASNHKAGLLYAKAVVLLDYADRDAATASVELDPTVALHEADRALLEGMRSAEQHKQRLWRAWLGSQRARVIRRLGRLELGRAVAYRAMEDFARMAHRYGTARCRLEVGRSYLSQHRPLEALPALEEARHTLATCGDRWIEAETAVALAQAQQLAGRTGEATRELRLATGYYELVGDPVGLATATKMYDELQQRQRRANVDARQTTVGFWAPPHSD